MSVTETVRSDAADIRLFERSRTAPASMSSCGVVMAFTVAVSVPSKSNVIELVPLLVMIPLESVTPPELAPDSRTWILEASWAVVFNGLVKYTASMPLSERYDADWNSAGACCMVTETELFAPNRFDPAAPILMS